MVSVVLEIIGNPFVQSVFNLIGVVACGDTHAVGNAENVGINCDGGMPPIHLQDYVRRFSTHSGQAFERCAILWYFAPKIINQNPRRFHDVGGLGVIQTDGLDVLL